MFGSEPQARVIRYPLPLVTSLLWLLLPLLLLVAVLDLLTMSPARRAQLLRRSGLSQLAISERLGVSRYRVRQYLAA
jgi:hypothetical protein